MQENAPQAAAAGGVRAPPAADEAMDEDDDPELAAALAMSMAETQPGTSTEVCNFCPHRSVYSRSLTSTQHVVITEWGGTISLVGSFSGGCPGMNMCLSDVVAGVESRLPTNIVYAPVGYSEQCCWLAWS